MSRPYAEPAAIPPQQSSIAGIGEQNLVRALRANPVLWDSITNIVGLPENPLVRLEVPLDGAPGQPKGDIDILLFERYWPVAATAIQVKRIKVKANAFEVGGEPNGLQGYAEGAEQANLLAQVGFGQVYLYLLVVVDSRQHNEGRLTYAGLTPELRRKIDDAISIQLLDPRVGLAVHEFIQPMDYAPLTVGAGGTHLVRQAQQTPQAAELTTWIARLGET